MYTRIITLFASVLALFGVLGAAESELSPQDIYNNALMAYKNKQWKEVTVLSETMVNHYPDAPFLADLYYFSGEAYYNIGDFEQANRNLSTFLEKYASPKYFEDAMQYKYLIAEQFEKGAKKHVFGKASLPMWVDAREDAYEIYDEVIQTNGRGELAAKSLYRKSNMLREDGKYKESVECLQALIRRFPKHHLGADGYLMIAEIYKSQLSSKSPDSDLLDMAQLNYRKFQMDYPSEDRLVLVEQIIGDMMDVFALDLWKSAVYFDKKRKWSSAALYYRTIINRYPQSKFAHQSMERLSELKELRPSDVADLQTSTIDL